MKWHEYPKRHVHQQLVTSRSLTSRQPHRISSRRASTVLYHTVKTIPAPRGGNNSPDHQQEIQPAGSLFWAKQLKHAISHLFTTCRISPPVPACRCAQVSICHVPLCPRLNLPLCPRSQFAICHCAHGLYLLQTIVPTSQYATCHCAHVSTYHMPLCPCLNLPYAIVLTSQHATYHCAHVLICHMPFCPRLNLVYAIVPTASICPMPLCPRLNLPHAIVPSSFCGLFAMSHTHIPQYPCLIMPTYHCVQVSLYPHCVQVLW